MLHIELDILWTLLDLGVLKRLELAAASKEK